MRRNKLNRLILGMLTLGILLTAAVNLTVGNARQRRQAALETSAPESMMFAEAIPTSASEEENYGPGFAETGAADAAGPVAELGTAGAETIGPGSGYNMQTVSTYEEFRKKFSETEATIEKMRASEKKNQSEVERQNSASSQLRYWETQMNSVYQTIMSVISTEEAAMLSRDQQDWKKQREKEAAEAARNSAGSRQESTEYTLSQAEATRKRAYELLERYRDRL